MAPPKEQDHPFYKPLWRRIAIIAVVLAWLVFELVNGGVNMWSMMAFALLVYGVYLFFLSWPRDSAPPKT